MILGIGNDLANIERIEEALLKFGDRFINRAFSENEKLELSMRKNASLKIYAGSVAKRFAAKEACVKALGTGFRDSIFLKDIEITHLENGKPVLKLYNGALKQLEKMAQGKEINTFVTMSDDYPWAQAFVILEIS